MGLFATPRAFAQEPASAFVLPDLPNGFAALEPSIDAKTMEIHHGKHHAGYVANLNAAVAANPSLKEKSLAELVPTLPSISNESVRTAVRNNGDGHWNHSFFFEVLAPAGKGGKLEGPLEEAMKAAFGSVDEFRKAFAAAAGSRFGAK